MIAYQLLLALEPASEHSLVPTKRDHVFLDVGGPLWRWLVSGVGWFAARWSAQLGVRGLAERVLGIQSVLGWLDQLLVS